jgi:hypothetical protein
MNPAARSDVADGRDDVWDAQWRFSAPVSLFVIHKTVAGRPGTPARR